MPYYHGTRTPYRKGGLLIPRSQHGGEATKVPMKHGEPVPDAADYVYVTEDLFLAWAYAWGAPGKGRPRVLSVDPIGTLEPDTEHSAEMQAWRCDAGVVRSVMLDPIISKSEAEQGWVLEGS